MLFYKTTSCHHCYIALAIAIVATTINLIHESSFMSQQNAIQFNVTDPETMTSKSQLNSIKISTISESTFYESNFIIVIAVAIAVIAINVVFAFTITIVIAIALEERHQIAMTLMSFFTSSSSLLQTHAATDVKVPDMLNAQRIGIPVIEAYSDL